MAHKFTIVYLQKETFKVILVKFGIWKWKKLQKFIKPVSGILKFDTKLCLMIKFKMIKNSYKLKFQYLFCILPKRNISEGRCLELEYWIGSCVYWHICKLMKNTSYNKCAATQHWESFLKGDLLEIFLFIYDIQHCFICHPSVSIVSEDAGIEPRTVRTTALAARRSEKVTWTKNWCSPRLSQCSRACEKTLKK